LELASLLSFSSRITRAVAEYNPATDSEVELEQAMHAIEGEYLQFIHRFRFTGASNHLQARELTEIWRRNLRLPELFQDLHEEITSATDFLFNSAASRSARTVERLTVIGTIGLVVALTLSFLGMSTLIQREDLVALFHIPMRWLPLGPNAAIYHMERLIAGEISLLALTGASSSAAAVLMWRFLSDKAGANRKERGSLPARAASLLKLAALTGTIIGLLSLAVSYWLLLWA
jgi:hypothetical protein